MQTDSAERTAYFTKSNFKIFTMIKITLKNSQIVYLAKEAIMEIYPMPDSKCSVIRTACNEYIIDSSEVQHIVEETNDSSVDRLSSTIRNLTNILRARLH